MGFLRFSALKLIVLVVMTTTIASNSEQRQDSLGAPISSLNLINKQHPGPPCHTARWGAETSSYSELLTTEHLCLLMKSTETFTDGTQSIAVMTTRLDSDINAALKNCSFKLASPHQVWQLPTTHFDMRFLATEVQLVKYKTVKHILVFCTFEETAKLLIAVSGCQPCREYFGYTWFILFDQLLFTGIPIPENTITVQPRTNILQTRFYGHCETLTTTANYSASNFSTADSLKFGLYLRDGGRWVSYGMIDNNGTIQLDSNHEYTLRNYPEHGRRVKQANFVRVVTIIEPPYTMIHEKSSLLYDAIRRTCEVGTVCWKYDVINDTRTMNSYCCVGYLMDLWQNMETDLGLHSTIHIVEDERYGEIQNGTWMGLVGDLVLNKADVAVASLNLNKKRMEVVDFSLPFLVGGLALVSRINEEPLPFVNFKALQSLTALLWALTMSVTILGAILIMIAAKGRESSDCVGQDTLFHFLGLFFQRDIGGKIPFNLSTAIISISVAMFTYLIMSTYTAVLTANYVSHTESLGVTGFKDPKITNPTEEFKYGTLANSAYSQLFRDSADPVWNRMHSFMKKYDFTDTDHAFHQLATGELDAVIHDYYVSYHYIAKNQGCILKYAGKAMPDAGASFAVRKGSVLQELITDILIKYQGSNWLKKWREPWFVNKCIGRLDTTVSAASIEYFGGVSILLAGTVVLCLCIFVVEVIVSHLQKSCFSTSKEL